MADIACRIEAIDNGWVANVTVCDLGRVTRHRVHVARESLDRLAPESTPDDLARASFAFLLEREPASSILAEFDIDVIAQYFPDYATQIRRRLAP